MIRLAHIINPVKVSESSSLHLAQVVTFESMLKAKQSSSVPENIFQYSICYSEDESFVPEYFIKLPKMERSVMDVGSFNHKRKLPLISDILNPLKEVSEIDYVIYTNADIALMPFFYDYVIHKINSGADSFIINRRVIKKFEDTSLINLYSIAGGLHAGFDCFVFKMDILRKCDFKNSCIGANWIGRALYANLLTHSKRLEVIKDAHLTFHLGEDGEWLSDKFLDYDMHNKAEVEKIIKELIAGTNNELVRKELAEITKYMNWWYLPKEQKVKAPPKEMPFYKKVYHKLKKKLL